MTSKRTVTDQMGRQIELPAQVKRIISLVPSQTELLFDLGLEAEVVAITKFCVHPESWYRNKTRIGGTKKLDIEKIRALAPDLIIGNKEENEQSDIRQLEQIAPVWMSDIYTMSDTMQMIHSVGELCQREQQAREMVESIRKGLSGITPLSQPAKALYLIWNEPMMAAGGDTFIHETMSLLGLQNVYPKGTRYPECEPEQMETPDYVLLSSEPYPFDNKHIPDIQKQFPTSKIVLVDGEYFSWYGSRLLGLPAYLQQLKKELEVSEG